MNSTLLAKRLIKIQSTTGNIKQTDKILTLCKSYLNNSKFKTFDKNNTKSLLFYNTKTLPKRFKIILNAHLDVVPGKPLQFNPKVVGDRLYGRGAYDMKAAAAVMIVLFNRFAKNIKYPLGLQLVTDEETGGFNGTAVQVKKGIKSDLVIAGEPTNFNIGTKSKGIIHADIFFRGTTTHGAYPWTGKNPVWNLNSFLNNLKKSFPEQTKEVWKTTISPTYILNEHQTENSTADKYKMHLDIRYLPKDRKFLIRKIKQMLPKNSQLKLLKDENPQNANENNPYLLSLLKTAKSESNKKPQFIKEHGGNDLRYYTNNGSCGVTFGPLGQGLHTDNEWVSIKSLKLYENILHKFLFSLNN